MPAVHCQSFLHLLLLFVFMGQKVAYIQIPNDYKYNDLKQPPEITSQPVSQTAFSLDDINLNCEASGDPKPTFRWVKDGRQFGELLLDSGTLTADRTEELSFYQGTYRCYAANELGTAVSNLVLLITESIPTLAKEKGQKQQVFEEGASAMLPCNPPKSSVTPKIHWMDKHWRHILLSERVTTALDGNLYFANLLLSDSRDDYTCNAHYINASIILPKEPIAIAVKPTNSVVKNRPPQIKQPAGTHSSYLILKGQTLTLECIPDGMPTPSVHWERKDSPLSTTRATILNFDRWLQIDKVSEVDDGEYACTARNSQGSVTHYYTVTVEASPYWSKKPENHLYAPGETVRLDCQAEGIPTPNITWSINGVPVTGTDLDPRRRVSSGTLILTDVQYSDTAIYQCEANNKHGSILINTHVHVVELPPQILTEGQVYRDMAGNTVVLECRTFGSPMPKVDWEILDSGPALSDARMSQMINGNLEISNINVEDSGVYTCSVRDSNLTISAELQVLNRTKIVSPPQNLQVIRGKDVLLQCKYRVDPQLKNPTVQWKKNGHKISSYANDNKYTEYPDGSLKVMDVQLQDSGVYHCEISTELDSVNASGFITVQDKPKAPHSVVTSEKKKRSVTLSWTAGEENNSPVSEFIIEMKEDEYEAKGTWKEHKRVSQDINHLEIHLQPYCKYSFRVRAVNAIGTSDASPSSEPYSTPAAKPDMNPKNVTTVSTDPNNMIITWKELERRQFNGPGFKYRVYWRQASGMGQHWNESIVSGPPLIVNDTGTFIPYEIKVGAFNDLGKGPEPVEKLGYSGEDTPLEAPSGVWVEVPANKSSTIIVRWSPVSREYMRGHLLGYKIHLKRKGPRSHIHRQLEKRSPVSKIREHDRDNDRRVVKVYGNKVEEVVSGLHFYSNYSLTVTVFNSKGDGPHSEPHHFSTPEGDPGPPSHLTFDSPSETEITLRWKAPDKPNGVLTGYLLQYHEIVDKNLSQRPVDSIDLPAVTDYTVGHLNPRSRYLFYLMARNNAGNGDPIIKEGETILDGEPPSVLTITAGVRSVNLSWVPGDRHRNFPFSFHYQKKISGSEWEESEQVNSTQGFYHLQGLHPDTEYYLQILSGNTTHNWEFQTNNPEMEKISSGFATQGWFIGLLSAVVLILLVLLILCFIKRGKGGKYSVKDKEEGQAESGTRTMKDDAFGEYRSLESDNEKCSISQPSICESKRSSNDSLADYGDSVDIQFNEDGSFIGQYSGRRDPQGRGGHDSSGATSPMNPNIPPPSISFPNSVTGILGPN